MVGVGACLVPSLKKDVQENPSYFSQFSYRPCLQQYLMKAFND